jgi:hypothetical protein
MATMQSQTMRLARDMYCQCAQAPNPSTAQDKAMTTTKTALMGKE